MPFNRWERIGGAEDIGKYLAEQAAMRRYRCIGCGLLAQTPAANGDDFREFPQLDRRFASTFMLVTGDHVNIACRAGHPIGFEASDQGIEIANRAAERGEDVGDITPYYNEGVARVIERDRSEQCQTDFEPHLPGLSPLWHWEHQRMKDIAKMQVDQAKALQSINTRFNWVSSIFGLLALVISVVTLCYAAGFLHTNTVGTRAKPSIVVIATPMPTAESR